ncbi:SDR family oxidoreductase [Staphylococcus lugdunensis]|uniref:SDR family oxidoreductase n=2 Tax=Staphylococcus TaxID=1279 RepID=A0A4Q9WC64_STALU|nr:MULTISPECIES: SDR family oxidoreductase [Staphylococcus]AMG61062.1 oxidoreductase [Staphylococcus lugdunensis]ARJ11873.1 oxidoreductase [Staphylococcus lugdunensis]AST59671.1 NAD(P)-dependent oxidoreductase [Staphylococcus lugdunensis]ATG69298.1 NAD(P)-dependent oxidoreductase [Staphylococcus lugdunensis]ATN14551.1 NAD(P)-dependent oxidoreductase [Staphylococcus lugdunensis]
MSKVIVITGASSGIGEATAKMLAKAGNILVIAARRKERLVQLVNDIRNDGGQAIYVTANVSKLEESKKVAQVTLENYKKIDVWINNAGLMPLSEFSKGLVEEWDQIIDVNLKGTLYGIDAALPTMRKQQSGHIINIASLSAHQSGATTGVYSATKFGVRAASEALRQEEASVQSNIRVTVISPGAVQTELPQQGSDQEIKDNLKDFYSNLAIPPEQVARTIQFAIDTPVETSINEIIIRPTAQAL